MLATWAGGTGVLLTLFAIIVEPLNSAGILVAIALSAVLCGLSAAMLLFGLRDHVSGACV